jgi:uracil-DNA glycosylase
VKTGASSVRLEASWLAQLAPEFQQPYMGKLRAFLQTEKRNGKRIFPPGPLIFNAFKHTPLPGVRVVILGQDPYHGEGQAHGLCFSVRRGVDVPPSLQNIFKELHTELGLPVPAHGDLTTWADRGVLLLNSVLSVASGCAGSHRGRGWERFTDRVIEVIDREREGVVFMLWGSYARQKGAMIDRERHCVLESPHPSPLSAYRGFFGCGHFRAGNDYLATRGEEPLDWSLPDGDSQG